MEWHHAGGRPGIRGRIVPKTLKSALLDSEFSLLYTTASPETSPSNFVIVVSGSGEIGRRTRFRF